uniref:Uncharacterized protein n=1 Tax=Arundo donax TaxID=35708 RepID=A0A0A9BJJ6_ARUDO
MMQSARATTNHRRRTPSRGPLHCRSRG